MPFFLPALFGLANGLAGLFGNKNKQTQTSESESSQSGTSSSTGVSSNIFDQTSTQGFAPQFAGQANDLINQIFGRSQGANLDPEQLRIQELAARNRANTQANNVFQSVLGSGFSRGLANSPASSALARGLTEGFRGSEFGNIANNFAQQRFQLPLLQEQINSSQRGSLLNLLNLLPRSTTSSGTSTTNSNQSNVFNNVGNTSSTSTGTTSRGNPILNALGAGLVGFGAASQNIDQLRNIFGLGNNSSTNAFAGIPLPNIPTTPQFNPNVSSVFPVIQNPFNVAVRP